MSNTKNIREQIIDYIRQNRVSTTEVADCLGKSGLFENSFPVNRGHFKVGPVHWMYAYNESNWTIHEMARDVKKGEIVMMEAFNCGRRAIVGELVLKFILLYKEAEAVISNGPLRDGNDLIKHNFPAWCSNITPIGTFNTKQEEPLDPEIEKKHREMYHGAIAVCDDSGVIIIPKDKINEEFLEKLHFIEAQEDTWFDCIDRRKWDTFDTVCLKKYLEEE